MNHMIPPPADPATSTGRSPSGPHPGVIGLVSLALLIAGLISMAALSGGAAIPPPTEDTAAVAAFFIDHPLAARVSAMLQLGSSIPLGIYAATMYAWQRRQRIRVPGPSIALFGGTAAAILLAVSAIVTWTQSQGAVRTDPGLIHALSFLSLAAGGIAHVLGLGLLVAGIAVPALLMQAAPRWFAGAGLLLAALAELCILGMIHDAAQYLIPVARFGSLLWLIAAGFVLPAGRHQRSRRPGTEHRS